MSNINEEKFSKKRKGLYYPLSLAMASRDEAKSPLHRLMLLKVDDLKKEVQQMKEKGSHDSRISGPKTALAHRLLMGLTAVYPR